VASALLLAATDDAVKAASAIAMRITVRVFFNAKHPVFSGRFYSEYRPDAPRTP
jgi:hypothetical protein